MSWHKMMTYTHSSTLCNWSTKLNSRSTIGYKTLLEFQWGNYHWRWPSTQGDKNYHSNKWNTDLLKQLHSGHLGLTECLHRSKQNIYWPGLYGQIQTCHTCLKFSTSNCKQPPSQYLGYKVLTLQLIYFSTKTAHTV